MKNNWKISDLIDLEYFLNQEDNLGDENSILEKRDRKIFLEQIEPFLDNKKDNRKFIIGKWLEARRKMERSCKELFLPGDIFNQAYGLLVFLFMAAGFFAGTGAAFSYLVYKGATPLNVSAYLGIFVLTQAALLIMLGVYTSIYRNAKKLGNISIVRFFITSIIVKTAYLLKKSSFNRLSAEKRNSIQAALGLIRGKSRIYGRIYPWPVFIISQVFGVFFNIGILTATLLRVLGSDLAFGWQSTLQLSSHAVYKAVTCISIPWSWFIPKDIAHPNLDQIEGTRMILKDGITSLVTSDLISWWPFLCFAVIFYGLFPRLILLITGITGSRLSIRGIKLHGIVFDKLILRLKTPTLDTEGESQINKRPVFSPVTDPESDFFSTHKKGETVESLVALVPEDIFDLCNPRELEKHIEAIFGTGLKQSEPVTFDFQTDKKILLPLLSDKSAILILQEAWQPPIKETMIYFHDLRQFTGPDTKIHIMLIGKPSPDTLFTPPRKEEMAVWKHKISALGDPNIALETISGL